MFNLVTSLRSQEELTLKPHPVSTSVFALPQSSYGLWLRNLIFSCWSIVPSSLDRQTTLYLTFKKYNKFLKASFLRTYKKKALLIGIDDSDYNDSEVSFVSKGPHCDVRTLQQLIIGK